MKWLFLLLISACAGEPFQVGFLSADGGLDGSIPLDTSLGAGGSNSTMGSAGAVSTIGGESWSVPGAGDGGAGGTSENAGSGGSGGIPGAEPLCDTVPVWSVNCDFGEPTEYLRHGEYLYRAPAMPTDCNGNCPPFGAREDYCDVTDYVYELIRTC